MKIVFYTAGGTIDKVYFDKKSRYEIGESQLDEILREANITVEYEKREILQKDSLDITDEDRELIRQTIIADPEPLIILTHGTDSMTETARHLQTVTKKVIVMTGSMSPARFKSSDAVFNIASAIIAVQTLDEGVYIAMNGRIFEADKVRKNVDAGVFEAIP